MLKPPSDILYEDNHLLAVNKLPGQIVQGDKTGDVPLSELFKAYIKQRDQKPGNVFLGVAHRLDRPVGGVLLFAKTGKGLERVNALIRERQLQKTYWAVTRGTPPRTQDDLVQYLYKNEKQNKSYVCPPDRAGALQASLSYEVIGRSKSFTLLQIELHTGRHHQIRAQLSSIGCPVVGDLKYGDKRNNPDGGICLHARRLRFIHPVQKIPLEIIAPLPSTTPWIYFYFDTAD